jgi:nucleotide-binding universal stress UspA family protein
VVVGYDGSDAARRAVLRAADVAGAGGRILLLTAASPTEELALEGETAPPERCEPERLLDEAAALVAGRELEVARTAVVGEPAEALADAAREAHAHLIVVGARGESYLARTLRGSVGEKLVARAPCDVLVVR